jgi:hypothetical protein
MTRTAGILKNSIPNPLEISHSNKHTHYFAQQAEYLNPNTPPSRDISVSTSFHKLQRPRTPTKLTSSSKRRTSHIITAAMAKRELPPVDKSDKAGPLKKQKITTAVEVLDSDSERESPEVHMEEQPEASDASNDGGQQEASDAPDNDNADTPADGNAEASRSSKKPKARPIAECFTPFDVQPSKIAPAGTRVLDFWGIKPRTKDARPQDLHADQPSARESGGQTNPPLWEDRKWRFRTPNRMVKWVGHEAPDGLDENNAPDIDQEANLIYPLLNMAKKSNKNLTPRRELKYYFYEHGVPKDWNDKQAVKALNDRRVQSIERICVDPPWTVMERDYLAQLLADHPDASIWELTQWQNDYFIGEYTEDTGLATDEETSLFLSSGRTIESVRAQYMLYKVSYDKGLSPTGVREKKDKTDLGKARQKNMERRFGKPNAGDDSGDDSDDDSDDDSGDGPGDEGEKKAPKKKLDKKPSKPKGPTPDKKMSTTKKPAAKTKEATDTKKPATKAKKEKVEPTFDVAEDDTYESRFARYNSTAYTRDTLWNEILARNLHPKPTKSSVKSVKAAALAQDDMAKKAAQHSDSSDESDDEPAPKDPKPTKKAARKDRAIKSGTIKKKPQQIVDSDDESEGEQAPLPVATFVPCVGEELAAQTAASDTYKLQPKLGDLDEELAELGGAYHPRELRAETPPPPPPQRYMSFSSISDFSESPSDIENRKRKADDSDDDTSSKRRRSDRSASIDESDDAFGTPMVTDPRKVQEKRKIAAAKTRVVEKKAGVQKKAVVAQAVEKVVKKTAKKAAAEETVQKTVETKKAVVAAPTHKAIRSVEIDEENYDDDEMSDVEGEFQLSPSDEEMEREVRGN